MLIYRSSLLCGLVNLSLGVLFRLLYLSTSLYPSDSFLGKLQRTVNKYDVISATKFRQWIRNRKLEVRTSAVATLSDQIICFSRQKPILNGSPVKRKKTVERKKQLNQKTRSVTTSFRDLARHSGDLNTVHSKYRLNKSGQNYGKDFMSLGFNLLLTSQSNDKL